MRLIYEANNPGKKSDWAWLDKMNCNMTFMQFTKSTKSVSDLTIMWLKNYERPKVQSASVQNERKTSAQKWLDYFKSCS